MLKYLNIIKVQPFSVNTKGEYDYFGDETFGQRKYISNLGL